MYKKCKCSHQSDVLTLDINQENQLVTGSTDNVICLWNSFNAVESKKIILPDDIASAQSGRSIQYLRFPFPNKKEILLVVITNGNCYILDLQNEKWLEFNYDVEQEENDELNEPSCNKHNSRARSQSQSSDEKSQGHTEPIVNQTAKRDKRLLGTIVSYPAIDLQKSYFAAVSETGNGSLNQITYHEESSKDMRLTNMSNPSAGRNRLTVNGESSKKSNISSNNRVVFEEISPFLVGDEIFENDTCFQIEICLEHNIFIVARQKGQISILSLQTCKTMAILNKGIVNIPKSLMYPKPQANKRLQQIGNA